MKVIDLLKLALINLLTFVFLDYGDRAGNIIFAIGISLEKQKRVLIQFVYRKKHLSRYKNGILLSIKKKYNKTKQKC